MLCRSHSRTQALFSSACGFKDHLRIDSKPAEENRTQRSIHGRIFMHQFWLWYTLLLLICIGWYSVSLPYLTARRAEKYGQQTIQEEENIDFSLADSSSVTDDYHIYF